MFERASRLKIRYETSVGLLSVEDLWDLPLIRGRGKLDLDEIAKSLHKEIKDSDEVSFVVEQPKSNSTLQLKFDIVKHIIEVKLAEQKEALQSREKAEKRQKILQIIAEREDDALKTIPLEELKGMLD